MRQNGSPSRGSFSAFCAGMDRMNHRGGAMPEENQPRGTAAEKPTPVAPIERYGALKVRLLDIVNQALELEMTESPGCRDLMEKLEAETFNLVVVGQFKRGKTCLVNALMGTEILPVAVVPLTSIVTILEFGHELKVRVFFEDGRVEEIGREALPDYVTEIGNPRNARKVKEVVVTYPSPYLRNGVRLVDTPGVGSIYLHNTDAAYEYLPKSDAALFLLSVDQPVGQAELDFLKDVRQYADRIFFLLNKIDHLTDEEIRAAMEFSTGVLKETVGAEVRMFPVSAKLALNGKAKDSTRLLRKSGMTAFSDALTRFLLAEKGKILLISAANNLLRILSHARLGKEIELKTLTAPLEDLESKIEAFHGKRKEMLAEKERFDILLEGEIQKLVRNGLDEDIASFRREVFPRMEESFDAFHAAHKHLSLKELNDALEAHVRGEIERAFAGWRPREEDKTAEAFQVLCRQFLLKMNGTVDELLRFSSQLFTVPFETVSAESLWTTGSEFSFKLREEPVGLDLLTASLTQVWPRYISERAKKFKDFVYRLADGIIRDKRRRHMLEAVEMQLGRTRHDLVERLAKGKAAFRREMHSRMDDTVRGIVTAIEKGMSRRQEGEKETEARRPLLADEMSRLDILAEEAQTVKAEAALL